MVRGPYIGLDVAGCVFDKDKPLSVVSSYYSDDVSQIQRTRIRVPKLHTPAERFTEPYGSFHFIVLTPELAHAARNIYRGPRTEAEESWRGSFNEFRMTMDAYQKFLEYIGFDPASDRLIMDAMGRPAFMRDELIDGLGRDDIPRGRVLCEVNADNSYWLVRYAHKNAKRLWDRHNYPDDYPPEQLFSECQIPFGPRDMRRFELSRAGRHERRELKRFFQMNPLLAPVPEALAS